MSPNPQLLEFEENQRFLNTYYIEGKWIKMSLREYRLHRLGLPKSLNLTIDDWTLAFIEGPKSLVHYALCVFNIDFRKFPLIIDWLIADFSTYNLKDMPRIKSYFCWKLNYFNLIEVHKMLVVLQEIQTCQEIVKNTTLSPQELRSIKNSL